MFCESITAGSETLRFFSSWRNEVTCEFRGLREPSAETGADQELVPGLHLGLLVHEEVLRRPMLTPTSFVTRSSTLPKPSKCVRQTNRSHMYQNEMQWAQSHALHFGSILVEKLGCVTQLSEEDNSSFRMMNEKLAQLKWPSSSRPSPRGSRSSR